MMLVLFRLRFIFRWLRFYLQAATKYDVHSPFVAKFVHYIVEDERLFYAFPAIERMRARLFRNNFPLEIIDLGAGSKANPSKTRSVRNVVRYSAVSEETGQQLFRLVATYKPKQIIELGTSLGISTLYLASAAPNGQVITIEGCPDIASVAQLSFQRVDISNVSQRIGDFKTLLPQVLNEIDQLDFLFIDGDHRAGNSVDYFEQALAKIHAKSIIVIADIHWSNEMEQGWEKIRKHPRVKLSIDLLHLGVLFFDESIREVQHLSIIKWGWKPWRLGLFGQGKKMSNAAATIDA
ncbi:MAG: class I SAM-dependent methyltransferase [Haliscomenobacter sp.]|nr:class I SAM-dependent methyltransferase [Haliscomenobacter sp.]MBK9490644.1 class I SAM-dependent methyltransferase [Haliscomenobacter sp.]